MYITISNANDYLGIDVFDIGKIFYLKKDPSNKVDSEAIRVTTQNDVTVGYVANSINEVAKGTHSAGYIYNQDANKCKVEFVVNEYVIAKLLLN